MYGAESYGQSVCGVMLFLFVFIVGTFAVYVTTKHIVED